MTSLHAGFKCVDGRRSDIQIGRSLRPSGEAHQTYYQDAFDTSPIAPFE
jgi:hypothetical protein